MRFSVWPAAQRPWSEISDEVVACDRAGWDGVYFADHFMPDDPAGLPTDGPVLECLTVLSGLAARTQHVRLGPLVLGNVYRHPAIVANMAAAIDQISGGRFVLGVGAGWQINEHAAYGLDLGTVTERLDRFEEACQIITSLLADARTTVEGAYYTVRDAPCDPKPAQAHLPLLIGGTGERRTLRIAAQFADEWNGWCTPDTFRHKAGVLEQHCAAVGRDRSSIACSTQAMVFLSRDESWLAPLRDQGVGRPVMVGTPEEMTEQVEAYRAAGVDELIIPDWTMGSGARAQDTLDLFWSEVAAHFR